MATYRVALMVKDSSGRESREDIVVTADDRNEAVREAAEKLHGSLTVKKTISVEKIGD